MREEHDPSKQRLEKELGQLLFSLVNAHTCEERQQCLRFIESTLRRLVVLRRGSRAD